MNHETASQLLADLLAGSLAPADRASAEDHVATCPECQAVVSTMRSVREEVSAHGESLFDPHPAARDLAASVLAPQDLSQRDLARVRLHLAACPTCAREAALTLTANRSADAWWRPFAFNLRLPEPSLARLAPALAALVILLIYPSYLGIVRLPEATRGGDREMGEARRRESQLLSSLQETREQLQLQQRWGGGVKFLHLQGARRGAARAAPVAAPRPGQPLQPIIVDYDATDGGTRPLGREITIVIRRQQRGDQAWAHRARAEELWDATNQGLTLLVPTSVLAPGNYRLEVRESGEPEPVYSARFVVASSPPSR